MYNICKYYRYHNTYRSYFRSYIWKHIYIELNTYCILITTHSTAVLLCKLCMQFAIEYRIWHARTTPAAFLFNRRPLTTTPPRATMSWYFFTSALAGRSGEHFFGGAVGYWWGLVNKRKQQEEVLWSSRMAARWSTTTTRPPSARSRQRLASWCNWRTEAAGKQGSTIVLVITAWLLQVYWAAKPLSSQATEQIWVLDVVRSGGSALLTTINGTRSWNY